MSRWFREDGENKSKGWRLKKNAGAIGIGMTMWIDGFFPLPIACLGIVRSHGRAVKKKTLGGWTAKAVPTGLTDVRALHGIRLCCQEKNA
jgi:hypothetical protein